MNVFFNSFMSERRMLNFVSEGGEAPRETRAQQTPEQERNIKLSLIRRQCTDWLQREGIAAKVEVEKATTFNDVRDEFYMLYRQGESAPCAAMPVQKVPTRLAFLQWVSEQLKIDLPIDAETKVKYAKEIVPTIKVMGRPSVAEINTWLLQENIDATVVSRHSTGFKGVDVESYIVQEHGEMVAAAPAANFATKTQLLEWVKSSLIK